MIWDFLMFVKQQAKTVDIDVSGKGCIMLAFTGDDVLGTWGDAHIVG